jgi:hypothetical protein
MPSLAPISMMFFFFASRAISMSVLKAISISQGADYPVSDVITGKLGFRRAFSDMSRAVFASRCFRWET